MDIANSNSIGMIDLQFVKDVANSTLQSGKLNNLKSSFKNEAFKSVLSKKLDTSKSTEGDHLKDVCQQFEAVFVNQMLKSMEKTVHKENNLLYGGAAEDIFNDMLYNEYSLLTAKTLDFGIAKQMYNQLSQKSIITDTKINLKA